MSDNYVEQTFQIIKIDNVINWVLGAALILVPDFFNRLFFGHEVLSHWIYIVVGAGLVWCAVWQTENFLKQEKLEVPSLRLFAILAWISVLVLTTVLLMPLVGGRLLLVSKIVLWAANIYMLLLGGWYWWVSRRLVEKSA